MMKKKLINLAFLAVVILPFALGATCKQARLEPGGSYAPVDATGAYTVQPDLPFYQVDAAFAFAYSALDAAFKFESDNRVMLWKISPEIKHSLDRIRPDAVTARNQYATRFLRGFPLSKTCSPEPSSLQARLRRLFPRK
jgi:hypothetical protein